jgi:hypothetical protein
MGGDKERTFFAPPAPLAFSVSFCAPFRPETLLKPREIILLD